MKIDNLNEIAKYEKAIKEKYGSEAIKNPKSGWDENKEKVKDVIIKSRKAPEEIIQKIEKEFGIKYVK